MTISALSLQRRRARDFALMLIGAAALLPQVAAGAPPTVSAPERGRLLYAQPDQPVDGRAWLSDCGAAHRAYHLDAGSSVTFYLDDAELEPGVYHLGLLARTGTHWNSPTAQTAQYRLRRDRGAKHTDLGGVHGLSDPAYAAIKTAGEPDSWANWYAFVRADRPVRLEQGDRLTITNLTGHGGVMAVWLSPASGPELASLNITTGVPQHAFIHGQTPHVTLRMQLAPDARRWRGSVRLFTYDLLTATTREETVSVSLAPDKAQTLRHELPAVAGVYQVTAAIGGGSDDAPTVRQLLAYAPARVARDLPNDWPIAYHVDTDLPPLPGARWYRYFAMWPNINTAPGVYDWERFDRVFRSVQDVGGKLMYASDGSPLWTSSRLKAGMEWNAHATAWPPDDPKTLATFLDAMIQRYADRSGTLAAIEMCNEANTPARWRGTAEQMVEAAAIFKRAASKSDHPIRVVGVAASAGRQRGYIQSLVDAGLLEHVDAASCHFYEELMSCQLKTPINSLPQHVADLREPMQSAGFDLPMLNTESGIEFAPRQGVVLIDQNTLNRQAEADPTFSSDKPWLVQGHWRPVSERRAAACFVSGTVMLLASGFQQTFCFTQIGFIQDGVPSLPWVALSQLGDQLDGVDYHHIERLSAIVPGSDGAHGSPLALAYRLGKPGEKQVIVAWAFLSDTKIGRSKHWQKWLEPITVEVAADLPAGELHDLYGRSRTPVASRGGRLLINCGEEPVFITTGR